MVYPYHQTAHDVDVVWLVGMGGLMITREKCGWGVPRQFSSLGVFFFTFSSVPKNVAHLSL